MPVDYREPVELSSTDGVLEVRLSAHQGKIVLDTAPSPIFLLFGYEIIRGTASDGSTWVADVHPAPTLRVDPGERLIIYYDNDLQDFSIEYFHDLSFIPAGLGNVYDYEVPGTMPYVLYWYHSHRHTLTAEQTYLGLAGLLEIGRPDGNLPIVTVNDIPIRAMALQYNFVCGQFASTDQFGHVHHFSTIRSHLVI